MRLEIVQGTENANSASQQEDWNWWVMEKVKEGKEKKEVQEGLVVLWYFFGQGKEGRRNGRG